MNTHIMNDSADIQKNVGQDIHADVNVYYLLQLYYICCYGNSAAVQWIVYRQYTRSETYQCK